MDFQKLKHLLAVVEHGTFSRAAEAVNLSQPALSRSIQALETELGLPLLDRGTRRLRLTAYGACAVERARRMRHEETELQRELKRMHGGESGSLNIGLSPTPASLLLSPLLAHMTARHPQVRVSVSWARPMRCWRCCAPNASTRWSATRACCTTRRTSTRSRWRRCAPAWCAGPDIPSWRIGASASRRSGNTRSRPPRSVRKSRCGWPRPWAPAALPNKW